MASSFLIRCSFGCALLAAVSCSGPAETRGAVLPSTPQALHAEYPAWIFDGAHGWDALERPLAVYLTGSAERSGGVDAAEDRAFDVAMSQLGAELAVMMIEVGRSVANDDRHLADVLTGESFIDDVLTVALDRSADRDVSEPRLVGKWFDLDNVIVRMRYDVERALLPTYIDRAANARRTLGGRHVPDDSARIRQAFLSSVARVNHSR